MPLAITPIQRVVPQAKSMVLRKPQSHLFFGSNDILSTKLPGLEDTVGKRLDMLKIEIEWSDHPLSSVHLATDSQRIPALLEATFNKLSTPEEREVFTYSGPFMNARNIVSLYKDPINRSPKPYVFVIYQDMEQQYSDKVWLSIHGYDQSLKQWHGDYEFKDFIDRLEKSGKKVVCLNLCNTDKALDREQGTNLPALLREMKKSQHKTGLIDLY
jgi:hypothetical protein